jgi:hypothetical protein
LLDYSIDDKRCDGWLTKSDKYKRAAGIRRPKWRRRIIFKGGVSRGTIIDNEVEAYKEVDDAMQEEAEPRSAQPRLYTRIKDPPMPVLRVLLMISRSRSKRLYNNNINEFLILWMEDVAVPVIYSKTVLIEEIAYRPKWS